MPRRPRVCHGGIAYHVMNRAAGRVTIFEDDADYAAFEHVLAEAVRRFGLPLCAYCLMPNHFHLVPLPREDGQLSAFMQWLTMTHSQRWHAHRHSAGRGHLYQGRFRCFPVQYDEHFLGVCRYAERNALRSGLVERAECWRWCSLWRREYGSPQDRAMLCEWPVVRPGDWVARVNEPETATELAALRDACRRGRPYGPADWAKRVAAELGIEASLRPLGRPRKARHDTTEIGS